MAEKHSSDILKCPVCLEIHTELKTLPCQDSFCLNCLEDWLKKKGELECPNCRQVHQLSENQLQGLTSKTAVKKVEQLEKILIKCCCNKDFADFYCKECSKYLCKECKKCHELFPALQNHSPQELEFLEESSDQTLCAVHERDLDFFCKTCKIPICTKCKDVDHRDDDEQHEPVAAADAFDEFKEKATVMIAQANVYMRQVRGGIKKCTSNSSKLSACKNLLKKDISNTVEELVKFVRESGKALEEKLEKICDLKDEKSNAQICQLNAINSDVKEKQDAIAELLKVDAARALQSGQEAIDKLQEMLNVVPEIEPRDDGKVYYTVKNVHVLDALKEHGIGFVSEETDVNIFEIVRHTLPSLYRPTLCQIQIEKLSEYETDTGLLNATWTYTDCYFKQKCIEKKVKQIDGADYVVKVPSDISTTFTMPTLDIKFGEASIKGSPLKIAFSNFTEKQIHPLLNGYDVDCINKLLVSKNGYFFVSGKNNHIGKFQSSSGAYMSKIMFCKADTRLSFSQSGKCCGIWELNNNDLVLCDSHDRKIMFYKPNGQLYKSLPTGQNAPLGIDINESLNLLYIAESGCVNVFDMVSGDKVKTIGTKGSLEGQLLNPSSVAITKEGNIIVADTDNSRVQLFDNDGIFKDIFIGGGSADGMVIRPSKIIVDNDDLIIASEGKVQLFDGNGNFIKLICGGGSKKCNYVISIFSYNPRRLAVAELNTELINIIKY